MRPSLASAPFPGEPGKTYADRVRRMALDARRIARGAEKAISTILSALSSPPVAEPAPAHFSTAGGPESEAAMAAAVADMALRLKQQPLEEAPRAVAQAPPPAEPVDVLPVSAAPPLRPPRRRHLQLRSEQGQRSRHSEPSRLLRKRRFPRRRRSSLNQPSQRNRLRLHRRPKSRSRRKPLLRGWSSRGFMR